MVVILRLLQLIHPGPDSSHLPPSVVRGVRPPTPHQFYIVLVVATVVEVIEIVVVVAVVCGSRKWC